MSIDIDLIEKSMVAIEPKLDELTMTVYINLFDAHPEARAFFEGIDLARQQKKLAAMLALIVTNLRQMEVLLSVLSELGARHIDYGTAPEHYPWVHDALMKSLEKVAGEHWNAETGQAWSDAIMLIAQQMLEGAARPGEFSQADDSMNEDLSLLMEIAGNPSLSFERNSLFAGYIEKKKTVHEMQLAKAVQQSLIPREFPRAQGYEFCSAYAPAMEIGGDYFDWIVNSDGRINFVFGDVSGKGVAGALIMCRLSGIARAILSDESDMAVALNKINRQISFRMPGGRFVTLVVLSIDPKTHRYSLANAGHPSPLYHTNDGCRFLESDRGGIPVGIEESQEYEAIEGKLASGDSLVLFTDGVTEANSPGKQQYGMDRLKALTCPACGNMDIAKVLLEDVRVFQKHLPQSDDISILSISRI
jgi:serine phosphatase RsbU (regulator of sigma subunit)/hemoglobin-like flavoprotein